MWHSTLSAGGRNTRIDNIPQVHRHAPLTVISSRERELRRDAGRPIRSHGASARQAAARARGSALPFLGANATAERLQLPRKCWKLLSSARSATHAAVE